MSELDDFAAITADVGQGWVTDRQANARRMLHELMDSSDGKVPLFVAQELAALAGRDVRTIRRWQRDHRHPVPAVPGATSAAIDDTVDCTPGGDVASSVLDQLTTVGPAAFQYDDTMMALMYLLGGQQVRLREELIAAGYPVPSLATFSRKWSKVSALQRNGAKHGLRNHAKHLLHIRHSANRPNDAWQFDSFNLDIYCRKPQSRTPVRPWLLLLVDDASRFIVSWSLLSYQMRSAEVLATFGAGFDVRPADDGSGVLIGGYPNLLLFDNEKAIRSKAVSEALNALPLTARATPAYMPTAKGKIERVGGTIQANVIIGQPGQVTRSERKNGEHLLQIESSNLLRFEQILDRVADVVHRYNYEDPHRSLAGQTPFKVYSQNTPIRRPDDAELAPMMVPAGRGGVRKVAADGVQAHRNFYVEAGLADYIGKSVNVRSWLHDHRRIAIFEPTGASERFVQMLRQGSDLDVDERRAIVQHRIDETRAVYRHAAAGRDAMREITKGATGAVAAVTVPDAGVIDETPDGVEPASETPDAATPDTTEVNDRSTAAQPVKRAPRNSNMKRESATHASAGAADKRRAQSARRLAEEALDTSTNGDEK